MAKKYSMNNMVVAIIITAIIVVALSYMFFNYLPQQKKIGLINDYKKASYEGILCQYTCPLELQKTTTNKTELLPNANCVKTCAAALKAKNINPDIFSATELKNDNFFTDILKIGDACKNENLNQTTLVVATKPYFDCVAKQLRSMNETYNYIN